MPTTAAKQKAASQAYRMWQITAATAAVFCVVACAAMIFQFARSRSDNPLKSPQLIALKEKLAASPEDEALKLQIRDLDFRLRQRYFHQVSLNNSGAWLAALGFVVMLVGLRRMSTLRRQMPMPGPHPDLAARAARETTGGRRAVLVVAGVVAMSFVVIGATVQTAIPARQADLEKLLGGGAASTADAATMEEMQANSPRFRGADGNGFITNANVALTWDEKTGAGVLWKSPVPAPGFNSPIVWKNRVYFSGGDAKKRNVMCFDADNGKIVWDNAVENVPNTPAEAAEVPEQCGFAAPTMATDGRRVYAIFASGELVAFTLEGKLAWAKHLGNFKNEYGHAVSLMTWQDKLIVQLDQMKDAAAGSKMFAYEGATGREVWRQLRPQGSAWASPIITMVGGKPQIITFGSQWVIANDARDGNEIWRAELLEGEITPSPIAVGGIVYVTSPSNDIAAVRPDGQGNVTKSHVLWKAEDNIPDVTSPVANGELVFVVNSGGMVTCYDAKDGKKVWEKDLNVEVQASPMIVGKRLFVFTTKGDGFVLEVGREFKQLARNKLEDKFFASPAVANGRMFVRGVKNLYCIGEKAK